MGVIVVAMSLQSGRQKILIWGKTYPELSNRYFETVCTAGVTETGLPVRLYPIPYRYLSEQFAKYQWITASLRKNRNDPRPESYKIDWDSIQCADKIPSSPDEWGKRAAIVFRDDSWQFRSVEELQQAQRSRGTSIAVVVPREIRRVELVKRPADEIRNFEEKVLELRKRLSAKQAQLTLFEETVPPEMKHLEFLRARLQVSWFCHGDNCKGHKMQVLDWEVCELQRRRGDDEALKKVCDLTDQTKYALRFFLGNLFLYPQNFMIVGLWYPKRANLLFS